MLKQNSLWVYICISVFCFTACQSNTPPVQGSSSIGDPYYSGLGNGGYEAQSYTLLLDVDPLTNTVTGKELIEANAIDSLSSFNLDFQGLTVDSIQVDKKEATFNLANAELMVTPSKPIRAGRSFTVAVNYHGKPTNIPSQSGLGNMGWFHADDGTINTMSEPDGASTWFPNNNHPRDKATYRFEITVPKPWIAVATGSLLETQEQGDKTTAIWEMDQPMASYLAGVDIGKYDLVTQPGPNGITIRNYFPPDYPDYLREHYKALPKMIEFLNNLYGTYPFKEYGVVIANGDTLLCKGAGADETQSLSTFCPDYSMADEQVIIHELAHQWFGDSVSLKNWKDVWLKEGMATYVEWQWLTKNKDLKILNNVVKVQMVGYYPSTATGNPPADQLYRQEVYKGGALVFHALRLKVGDDTFFKIMRAYLKEYQGKAAGTEDFIAVAEKVSGQDLKAFFDSWLSTNKIPGFPDL